MTGYLIFAIVFVATLAAQLGAYRSFGRAWDRVTVRGVGTGRLRRVDAIGGANRPGSN